VLLAFALIGLAATWYMKEAYCRNIQDGIAKEKR